eukprot:2186536-Amphidinium_carterae.2
MGCIRASASYNGGWILTVPSQSDLLLEFLIGAMSFTLRPVHSGNPLKSPKQVALILEDIFALQLSTRTLTSGAEIEEDGASGESQSLVEEALELHKNLGRLLNLHSFQAS